MSKLDNWLQSGRYLPPFLRDFHDQKDVFSTMHSLVKVDDNDYTKAVDWITGQCYVIDVFLWFMARRGYTLQRSRQKLPFRDLDDDIARERKRQTDQLASMIAASQGQEGGHG